MKRLSLIALLIGLPMAALSFVHTESLIPMKTLAEVEGLMNDRFRSGTTDPYYMLGTARSTYLDGYGVLTTAEIQLVFISPVIPFRPAYSPQEIQAMRDRKVKKLPELMDTMRELLVRSGTVLEPLPGNEHVALQVRLWRYAWEDSKGIPQRVFMSALKSKLLDARTSHADLTPVILEQEQ